ncbi:YetF domain-containing protein [Geosporobacter ferrireducens]|uniref:DUF421 domain-containing protein n=1 Tax=Geosporobacter ferrireducens TaxID=1424294 RepID=A0A1D8GJ08_9FIRM|nr:DUF421 domain-containing protein [Geosporobacter ferrireducens]AOT70895.1 hypothetical protein Gferi_15810 [Geosporobacter ferrireducens]MTI53600.1 DUF421 domain-containing protein [Geosporobacter ferrireducens]
MNAYLIIFGRIISIMLLTLFITLFIMGKRPIGELPVFDFITIIVIGAIVGADIADPEIKHLPTAFAVVVLALFQRLISYTIVQNKKVRQMITFEPTVIVQEGKILFKSLQKIHYTVDEVLMLLREKDIFDISKVAFAIVESNGNLSVLKKADEENPTKKDMQIPVVEGGLPLTVVLDGAFMQENIRQLHTSEDQIWQKLKEKGYSSLKDIFHASMDQKGEISISPYEYKGIIMEIDR